MFHAAPFHKSPFHKSPFHKSPCCRLCNGFNLVTSLETLLKMTLLDKRRRKKLQAKIDREYDYRTYCDRDVYVEESGPSGRGLFANRQFFPGELVIEVKGKLLLQKEYGASRYVMELSRKWYLEPDIPGAFANHSCNPNCELIQLTEYSMGVVAICNIEAGIEICYDYQWPALKWIPRCNCGAPTCRGWVVAEEEVPKMRKLAKKSNGRKRKAK